MSVDIRRVKDIHFLQFFTINPIYSEKLSVTTISGKHRLSLVSTKIWPAKTINLLTTFDRHLNCYLHPEQSYNNGV